MSCYNAEKTVARAIQSVLNQTYQDFELVIVNDCSTDNSEQVIKQFNDSRIKLINHSENKGAGLARRTAIANMSGDYMTFLDADDYLHPQEIAQIFHSFSPSTAHPIERTHATQPQYRNNLKKYDPVLLIDAEFPACYITRRCR